jgi:hypothetical protein
VACRGGGWLGEGFLLNISDIQSMIQPTVPLDLAGNGGRKEHLSALDYVFTFSLQITLRAIIIVMMTYFGKFARFED